jgi:hypothetical protein
LTPDIRSPRNSTTSEYIELDYLYMDNTFATHGEEFPPQEEAFDFLFSLISEKLKEYTETVS